ncbi:MAG: DUF2127 domain-containing protein [Clostridia bacterium]
MKKQNNRNLIHISFDVGLLLKGFNALLEIIGGIALVFLSPSRMNQLTTLVSGKELAEDPTDWLMNYLVNFGHTFSISAQQFTMFYLLSHGTVKMVIILLLWKKKLWAYPLSVVMLIVFIVYQLYHYTSSHSVMLLLLTLLDIAMIVLTVLEYRQMKLEKQ